MSRSESIQKMREQIEPDTISELLSILNENQKPKAENLLERQKLIMGTGM
jgi:hypothetical protein